MEIAPNGTIDFAMGASEALSGTAETALVGHNWADFIEPVDRRMLAMLLEGLEPGRRAGPVMVRLAAPERAVTLTALRLPQNRGAVSCALAQARYEPALFEGRLADRAAFETLTRDLLGVANGAGKELELSLVELAGLSAARSGSSPDAREEMEAQLTALLRAQAWGGAAATELENDRFALVRTKGETPDAFAARLGRLMGKVTAAPIAPSAGAMGVGGIDRPQQVVRALRYALDGYSREGSAWEMPANLADALNLAMDKALAEAGLLGAAISDKTFRLAYQPVVDLYSHKVHHFEVLVRFGEDESPFPQIRMAEELDLIEALDFAILERAVGVLAPDPELKLAVNVSGRTIISPAYIERAVRLAKDHPEISGRLMFELTESAAIDDLALADRHLQALREAGCEVCLDDFGAGAASLAYLQQLHLDVLKIDGRYIRDLQFGSRSATFVKHLVDMCRELGMKTLAEMVETSTVEDAVRRAGVDFAQGWLYGLAADTPTAPAPKNQWKAKAS
ncbi:EAL domain-containing protein [Phenylobacterium sp.]|uniref:EAL domain-containing protein n=1 Tax=Phenylobacterium sp. TaxID=1871053 RepID=UPI001206EA03|nr:EAL domain-containing protein [Phenylobacterium sp.]THD61459.1 MAG: EAL domain-containing protein [Phenylobacterium sp.]